jgi:hypothetical protein
VDGQRLRHRGEPPLAPADELSVQPVEHLDQLLTPAVEPGPLDRPNPSEQSHLPVGVVA